MIVPSTVRVFASHVGTRTPAEVLDGMVSSVHEIDGVTVVESSAARREESGDVDVHLRWTTDRTLSNDLLTAVGSAMWSAANPGVTA